MRAPVAPPAVPFYEVNPVQLNQAQIEEVAQFECNRRRLPKTLQPGEVTTSRSSVRRGTAFQFAPADEEDTWGSEQRRQFRPSAERQPAAYEGSGQAPLTAATGGSLQEIPERFPHIDPWLVPEKEPEPPEQAMLKPRRRMTYRDGNYRRQGDYGRGQNQ